MKMLYGQEERLLPWITQRIGVRSFMPDAKVIGLEREDGEVVVVVGYDRFTDGDVSVHIAYDRDKGPIPPGFWPAVYAYPFIQLDLVRVTSLVRSDNEPALKFCERQGFTREGVLRRGDIDADLVVFGMLREECHFLGEDFMRRYRELDKLEVPHG